MGGDGMVSLNPLFIGREESLWNEFPRKIEKDWESVHFTLLAE